MISADGRRIAQQKAHNFGSPPTEDDDAVRVAAIRRYEILQSLVVHGLILPALQIIQREHRITELDMVGLTIQSPTTVADCSQRVFLAALKMISLQPYTYYPHKSRIWYASA